MTMTRKHYIGFFLGVFVLIISMFSPASGGLTPMGSRALLYVLGCLIVLSTESMPIGVCAIFIMILQPVMGLTSGIAETAANIGQAQLFFLLSAFAVSTSMNQSPVTKRILRFFIKVFGKTTKGLAFALTVSCAVCSTFISNFPCVVLFMPIFLGFLELYNNPDEKKQAGKAMMLLIPVAATVGGICTPVGNTCMMMGAEYLSKAGFPVSFPQWFVVGGIPAIILLPLSFFIYTRFGKIPEVSQERRNEYINELNEQIPKKMDSREAILVVILLAMILTWLFAGLNTIMVMTCAAVCILFPGFKILSWQDYVKNTGWAAILLVLAIMSMVTVLTTHGVTQWMLDMFFAYVPTTINVSVLIFLLGIFSFIVLAILPSAPAVAAMLIVPFIAISAELGYAAPMIVLPITFFSAFVLILPLDAAFQVPYNQGYYTIREFAMSGAILSVFVALIISIWSPIAVRLLGF